MRFVAWRSGAHFPLGVCRSSVPWRLGKADRGVILRVWLGRKQPVAFVNRWSAFSGLLLRSGPSAPGQVRSAPRVEGELESEIVIGLEAGILVADGAHRRVVQVLGA